MTMSDSLRDQLLKAGFKSKETAENSGKKKRSQRGKPSSKSAKNTGKKGTKSHTQAAKAADNLEEEQRRKALKEQIKQLIETHCVKNYAGSEAYAFLVGKRVRQLFVTEEIRKRLSDSDLVITRLNGNTFLVPPDIGDQILAVNPQWAVFKNTDEPSAAQEDSDYADFQVPDDLIW